MEIQGLRDTDNETAEELAERRKAAAATMRKLADDLEAGKVPHFGFAVAYNCGKCPELHHVAGMHLDVQNTTGFLTIRGLAVTLSDAASEVIKHRAMQKAITRAQATHDAKEATKQ